MGNGFFVVVDFVSSHCTFCPRKVGLGTCETCALLLALCCISFVDGGLALCKASLFSPGRWRVKLESAIGRAGCFQSAAWNPQASDPQHTCPPPCPSWYRLLPSRSPETVMSVSAGKWGMCSFPRLKYCRHWASFTFNPASKFWIREINRPLCNVLPGLPPPLSGPVLGILRSSWWQ